MKSWKRRSEAGAAATTPRAAEPACLFVYGTLRRGFSRHDILERLGAQYVGTGTARAELWDCGDHPGARPSEAAGACVVGEIYRFRNPARAFQVLDQVEGFRPDAGHSSLFLRETATIILENGKCVRAWVYWLNRSRVPARRICSGDYAEKSKSVK